MGREVASALSRWFVLDNFPVQAELTSPCATWPSKSSASGFGKFRRSEASHRRSQRAACLARTSMSSTSPCPIIYMKSLYLDVLRKRARISSLRSRSASTSKARHVPDRRKRQKPAGRFVRCSIRIPLPARRPARVTGIALRRAISGKVLEVHSVLPPQFSDLDPDQAGELETPGENVRRDRRDGRPRHARRPSFRFASAGSPEKRLRATAENLPRAPRRQGRHGDRATRGTTRCSTPMIDDGAASDVPVRFRNETAGAR